MKPFIIGLVSLLSVSLTHADYTLIVPQKPGGGTSVWAEIIASGLNKFLDEPVVVRHIPSAKDIGGFNKFHNELQQDDKTIMVSHGGNGVSYLLDDVDYDYTQYSSIGMMNLDIVVGRKAPSETYKYAGASGSEPDGLAMAMLICGETDNVDTLLTCWSEKMTWVNGMSGGERRLAYLRGETNVSRESAAAWKKHMEGKSTVWFTHGIYDLENKTQMDDPNFPNTQFEDVFEQTWGYRPKGNAYEAYRMIRNWRDVIQKALWVRKGNPNTEKFRDALRAMLNDQETMNRLEQKTGKYPWIVGADGDAVIEQLTPLITEQALKDAVKWTQEAYDFDTVFKPSLIK